MGQYTLDNFTMAKHMVKEFYYFLMDHMHLEYLKTTCIRKDNTPQKGLNIKDNFKIMFFTAKGNKRISKKVMSFKEDLTKEKRLKEQ